MSRIEISALSDAQRAQLPAYGARWDALRRATLPPDHVAGAAAVHKAYVAAGLEPPSQIVWEQGPTDLLATWSKRRLAAGESVRDVLVDAVRRRVELRCRPSDDAARAHGARGCTGTGAHAGILRQHRRRDPAIERTGAAQVAPALVRSLPADVVAVSASPRAASVLCRLTGSACWNVCTRCAASCAIPSRWPDYGKWPATPPGSSRTSGCAG